MPRKERLQKQKDQEYILLCFIYLFILLFIFLISWKMLALDALLFWFEHFPPKMSVHVPGGHDTSALADTTWIMQRDYKEITQHFLLL